MPFKSKAQQRFMFAKHPAIAKRWADHTPDIKALPEHKEESHSDKEANMAGETFPERVVEALQISAIALQKAETERTEKQAADARYASLIPQVVDKCVKCGRIDDTPSDREKLAAWLATPEGALEVVDKMAEHEVAANPSNASLGQPTDSHGRPAGQTKKANFEGGGYVGRRSGEVPDSWKRLEAGLGLAS